MTQYLRCRTVVYAGVHHNYLIDVSSSICCSPFQYYTLSLPRTLNIRIVKDLFISFCADVARFAYFLFTNFYCTCLQLYCFGKCCYSMFEFFILVLQVNTLLCHFQPSCQQTNEKSPKIVLNNLFSVFFLMEVMAARPYRMVVEVARSNFSCF